MANTQGQDEYDLHEAWEKACRSFAATAKFDLRQDRALTPEEVISQLKAKRQKDDEKSAEFKVLKDVLWKSLTCIQTLGGIAAQGAGMVSILWRAPIHALAHESLGVWTQHVMLQCRFLSHHGRPKLQKHLFEFG